MCGRDCELSMIIFLYGADTFRSRQQLKKMIAKFKADRDPQGFNVAVLDCTTEDTGQILEQALSTPFLAEKRLIVLENLLSATKKADLHEEILKRLEGKTLPDANVYIFWEGSTTADKKNTNKPKTNASKKLLEILVKEKYAQEFIPLIGTKLNNWVAEEIKNNGGKIGSQAINYLVNNVGDDMWRLHSLIAQLTSYCLSRDLSPANGEFEICVNDINQFIEEKVDDNIFNLVDSLIAKNSKAVYKMIREQYRIGEDAQFIFAMILRQFRILIELRDMLNREDNINSDTLAKKLGLHPFVVKKSLPFAKKYNLQELKEIYQQLLEMDIKTKTGRGKPELSLDLLVGKICNNYL